MNVNKGPYGRHWIKKKYKLSPGSGGSRISLTRGPFVFGVAQSASGCTFAPKIGVKNKNSSDFGHYIFGVPLFHEKSGPRDGVPRGPPPKGGGGGGGMAPGSGTVAGSMILTSNTFESQRFYVLYCILVRNAIPDYHIESARWKSV